MSLGNIISIVGTVLTALSMVAAMVYWGGRLTERADNMEREMLRLQSTAAAHEARIRGVEHLHLKPDSTHSSSSQKSNRDWKASFSLSSFEKSAFLYHSGNFSFGKKHRSPTIIHIFEQEM